MTSSADKPWWRTEFAVETYKTLGIAAFFFLFMPTLLFQPFRIPSSSMETTLLPGDFLFVNKLFYGAKIPFTHVRLPGLRKPKPGDVIVFQFPQDPKAQLMGAFARYRGNKYDDAIGALDRFIQLHPGNRDTVYAYYLKALSYYEQITDVGRDQETTARARAALDELVRRFPDSRYSRDAKLKLDLTLDHLAGKEMEIGRYYLTRKQYLAGINRFRRVVDLYQTTTHVPEALHRLTECYLALGLEEEARKTASVLGHNYPGSEWYTDSYAILTGIDVRPQHEKRGFISRAWNTVF